MTLTISMRGRFALSNYLREHYARPENRLPMDDANLDCASEILIKIRVGDAERQKLTTRDELGRPQVTEEILDAAKGRDIELDGTQANFLKTFLKNLKGGPDDRLWYKPLMEQLESPALKQTTAAAV